MARLCIGDRVATVNAVYVHRLDNGSVSSGDGWRFRGRGPIQTTGREDYCTCGRGRRLEAEPDLLALPEHGFRAAGWYWCIRQLSGLAHVGAFEQIAHRINGPHGRRRPSFVDGMLVAEDTGSGCFPALLGDSLGDSDCQCGKYVLVSGAGGGT